MSDLGSLKPSNATPTSPASDGINSRKLLTTVETAAWLSERGVSRTAKTLEATRVRGGRMAPPFRKIGRAVRYAEADLAEWLAGITSAPFNSTTQAKAGGVA
jgi:hypothetical protein